MFVECILPGTQQTSSLSSATLKTLGKEEVCRASNKKHSTKRGLSSVFFFALGKEVKKKILGKKEKKKMKKKLCRVPRSRTLGKKVKIFFLEKKEKKKN